VPFKSQAQRRKFTHLLVDGKISDKTTSKRLGARRLS
jgi:hypothetical protein